MAWSDAIQVMLLTHAKWRTYPPEDHGFMYSRDLADPDGHLWAALWMDPTAQPSAGNT